MTDLVIAQFETQFAATSALEKLLSRGMRRDRGVVCSSESVGGSSASSSAPTTVVSRFSHHATPRNEIRAPAEPTDPASFAHATLTVELAGPVALEDIMQIMKRSGACGVHFLINQRLDREDSQWFPEVEYGSPGDVARAVDASR
ncbi:hypothetical protein [Dyella jiangningensis]|uniref:Uncharacterized protein n=1 Tax=Dyella jiangningensis TaxID=1379159 RepID=A0A328P4I6_9GAMM|nr:hypothetical protein [Dyella jiangningensis]RAO76233.1 hypothetical protein CA260_11090 [Dyella jiangningensis]